MTSNQHALYALGYTRATMAGTKRSDPARGSKSRKAGLSSDWMAAIRLHEGGITSNRGSACRGEYVPGVCTHRPSNHERWQRLKPLSQPQGGRRLGRGC